VALAAGVMGLVVALAAGAAPYELAKTSQAHRLTATEGATSSGPLSTAAGAVQGVAQSVPLPPKAVSATSGSAAAPSISVTPPPVASPASASQVFVGRGQVSSTGQALQVTPQISFLDAQGSTLATVAGQQTQATSGTWTTISPVAAIAPAETTRAVFSFDARLTGLSTLLGDGQLETRDLAFNQSSMTAPPVSGPLRTSGDQILDSNGNPTILRGVVLNGLEDDASSSSITQQTVMEAKAWGANIVRVPLGEQFWMPSNCNYVSSYPATVDKVVQWITSLGMVALLDLHYNTVGNGLLTSLLGGCQAGAQHNMADAVDSPEFWSEVAARYANNPLVAFDLYNEPNDISDAVWLNGGTTTDAVPPYVTYQAAGMQQLYDAVRNAGASNLVFISGNNWANTVPSKLVAGTNIVYAVHAYTCPVAAPPACANSDPYDPSQILDNWVSTSRSVPVAVTEFGWPSPYNGAYNTSVVTFAQDHGWSWVAFSWQTNADDVWDLASLLADGTEEPNPSGAPILLGLTDAG
jgi:endoglucanase